MLLKAVETVRTPNKKNVRCQESVHVRFLDTEQKKCSVSRNCTRTFFGHRTKKTFGVKKLYTYVFWTPNKKNVRCLNNVRTKLVRTKILVAAADWPLGLSLSLSLSLTLSLTLRLSDLQLNRY